jgi:hypothetical protein
MDAIAELQRSAIAVRSYSTRHASIDTKSLPQAFLAMSCTYPAPQDIGRTAASGNRRPPQSA